MLTRHIACRKIQKFVLKVSEDGRPENSLSVEIPADMSDEEGDYEEEKAEEGPARNPQLEVR